MNLNGKNILIFGLGISGISSIKSLGDMGNKLILIDSKDEVELKEELKEIQDIKIDKFIGEKTCDLRNVDLIVKSPGIPYSAELLVEARSKEIPIISDLELGYLLRNTDDIIAITGTNGKTSTTYLLGEIFKSQYEAVYLTGNLGIGTPEKMVRSKKEDIFIIECSSFQLEGTRFFKPRISLILNLKEDHINWHGSFENYIDSKMKILENQGRSEYAVLNYDDKILREKARGIGTNIVWFSSKEKLEKGVYIDDGYITIKDEYNHIELMEAGKIDMVLENVLAAICVAYVYGVKAENIKGAIEGFNGLEHRLEYVKEIDGVKYYNDSKATNPDAVIAALNKLEDSIVLIAGGYDKMADFNELSEHIAERVKSVILMGETKDQLETSILNQKDLKIYMVTNMKEAVLKAHEIVSVGDKVLLSPACAAWGLYKNFEERGQDFKDQVNNIRVD